jgi:dTDP-glucose 4,6-dehydratase/UDP-glucuronate decarboxylase
MMNIKCELEPEELTADQVVAEDLAKICRRLEAEFSTLKGKTLFISGGAGFLGHYLVQAVLHWNRTRGPAQTIRVIVSDNYIRGVPDWLTALEGDPSMT